MRDVRNNSDEATAMFNRSICITSAVLVLCGIAPPVTHAAEAPGQQAFAECSACHSTDGTPGVGPTLKGIVGRSSAGVAGFPYSSALKRAKLQWTAEQLDKYIANPQAAVPGNTMPYAGMDDTNERSALIAYLSTLK
jgi:cytochrome c